MKNKLKTLAFLICTSMTSLSLLGSEQKQEEKPLTAKVVVATTTGAGLGAYFGYHLGKEGAKAVANNPSAPYSMYTCAITPMGVMVAGAMLGGSLVYEFMTLPESKKNEK